MYFGENLFSLKFFRLNENFEENAQFAARLIFFVSHNHMRVLPTVFTVMEN
jgi:hypothetical protein